MLDTTTKRRIDTARDILVGKVPDPKSQVEQITIALIYKFMDDMDLDAEELGGEPSFFSGEYEKYGWRKIFNPSLGGFEMLSLYSEAILKMAQNPNLPQLFRDIFKNAYLPYRDPETLKSFLKIINDFSYDHSEKLGDAFEYLLSVLGSQGDAGQFRTPRHVIDFMTALIAPKKNETVLDPACGTAGFLISAYKHIFKENSSNYDKTDPYTFEQNNVKLAEITVNGKHYKGDKLSPDDRARIIQNIKGYDISPDMMRLSLVNLYLHGFTDPHIYEYDTLTSEERWNEFYDIILANPPFMSPKGGIRPHKRFAVQSKRSEVLFVDYMAEHLTPTGKAAIIVPEGIIFQCGTAYKSLRKMLVEDNYLVGVISLPAGVFNPYSGVKTSILWLDKSLAKKTDKILFAKIENDGFDLGAQRRPIKQNDLPGIFRKLTEYRDKLMLGEDVDFENETLVSLVEKEKIAVNGEFNLSGERYIERIIIQNSNFEFKNINEICELKRGTSITKKDVKDGNIPVIAGGQQPSYYHSKSNRPENSIAISSSGAYAGYISFHPYPIFASDCFTITTKNHKTLNQLFLYYLLKYKQEEIYRFQVGMGQPHVYPKDFNGFQIPLPPISVQEEIVAEIESYQKIIDGARQVVENYKPKIDIDP
ncbi:MAG: N-6 DNA methylase, partial [Bacteroidota bacterium]|nr:N-6 DNA methylase [Bacteroidota bacterium]